MYRVSTLRVKINRVYNVSIKQNLVFIRKKVCTTLRAIPLGCCIKMYGFKHIVIKRIHGNSKSPNSLPKNIRVSALNYCHVRINSLITLSRVSFPPLWLSARHYDSRWTNGVVARGKVEGWWIRKAKTRTHLSIIILFLYYNKYIAPRHFYRTFYKIYSVFQMLVCKHYTSRTTTGWNVQCF